MLSGQRQALTAQLSLVTSQLDSAAMQFDQATARNAAVELERDQAIMREQKTLGALEEARHEADRLRAESLRTPGSPFALPPVEFAGTFPWPMPDQLDCVFYHSLTYPDGQSIDGAWDIRGIFQQYIGNYPIIGKTLLDVGTAGGFLAFEAERAGAKVTALDALRASEFGRIPYKGSLYDTDRRAHDEQTEAWFTRLKNGFWYSWHQYASSVEMVYAPLSRLPYWERKFDVVLAGAIFDHLSDPVKVIGDLAGLAREALIIAFTPVTDSKWQFMETVTDWTNPAHNFTFWMLSRGLYERVFANLGFSVEIVSAKARTGGDEYTRPTIIARRLVD
jgi:2-polyprenyl-3-methyl-5-hydroxy-6-metoxy-1,4-benzoquinol methylase